MRTEYKVGENFLTRYELEFIECIIPTGTHFEIIEKLEDDYYKVHFDCCIYDDFFKRECEELNCDCKNEDGNIQVVDFDEIDDFRTSAMAEY